MIALTSASNEGTIFYLSDALGELGAQGFSSTSTCVGTKRPLYILQQTTPPSGRRPSTLQPSSNFCAMPPADGLMKQLERTVHQRFLRLVQDLGMRWLQMTKKVDAAIVLLVGFRRFVVAHHHEGFMISELVSRGRTTKEEPPSGFSL